MAGKTLRPIQFYVDEKEFDLIQEKPGDDDSPEAMQQ